MKIGKDIQSWIETHYEVVSFITQMLLNENKDVINKHASEFGTGGMYELAEQWTDEFEAIHINTFWDGEFFDEIESFLIEKNKLEE